MDWDIPPTTFNEYSTVKTSGASNVLFTSDDGFANANPLSGPSNLGSTGEFADSGPRDHGALFDFGFGALAAGASRTFNIFYGAASDEAQALAALAAVGADKVYSLGQASVADGASTGRPNTFIFGFSGVGEPPSEPVPEPLTILGSLAAGSFGVALRRKYNKQQQKETAKV
ncbi:PEP-CTERM sorting domain-containing protein [Scytonema tolypothrichoides VB-61278]|nr:PEP-CTERM sorting domain-containing protein [Scytonema tolypothrichoides VB-61278]